MPNDLKKPFDVLVVPHLERLFRVAHRLLGNTSDARDLVQDTCVAAFEHLAELETNSHPLHWLLRVQRNCFIDGARRRKRAPVVAMDLHSRAARFASAEPGPEDMLEQTDSERALERAFQQLDDNQRLLLTLRAEGYELEEIEAILGIDSGALRARLHRARRSLRPFLPIRPFAGIYRRNFAIRHLHRNCGSVHLQIWPASRVRVPTPAFKMARDLPH